MTKGLYTVTENQNIAQNTYKMTLSGDTSAQTRPGQFVNIALEGFFLRRPLSVCDWDENGLCVVYKTVGRGTEALSRMETGTKLDILTGLGNGFSVEKAGNRPLLIGGGAGVPPLLGLAKRLAANGAKPCAVLGFQTGADVFFLDEFAAVCTEVLLTTDDGSLGRKGRVTDVLPADCSFFYACGPEPMLHAVWKNTNCDGELSFEERMGCGFGACMGCSCHVLAGSKRICREGPVLEKREVQW